MEKTEFEKKYCTGYDIQCDIPVLDGKIHGTVVGYTSDNKLLIKIPFLNGYVNEQEGIYYKNGLLKITYKYDINGILLQKVLESHDGLEKSVILYKEGVPKSYKYYVKVGCYFVNKIFYDRIKKLIGRSFFL